MGNIHEADRGRPVRALVTNHRCMGPDFPGWGAPDAADWLRPITPGAPGVIVTVDSHGQPPYTRYSVRFGDGTHTSGLVFGQDFEFADGQPQRSTR
jgi:hypothetical protein